jgi:flagellar biosynthetic protein FlhB
MANDHDREQRTEPGTPRRREESRDRGQVALSSELVAGLSLCAGVAALFLGGGALADAAGRLILESAQGLSTSGTEALTFERTKALLESALRGVAVAVAVIVVPTLAVSLIAGYGQVGFRIATQAVRFDPARVDPVKGFGRIFGMRGAMRTALAGVKVLAIAATVASIAWSEVPTVLRLSDGELRPVLAGLGRVALHCTLGALAVVLALGLLDLLFQRLQHERDLRMTKQEVKEEHRLTDGDPHVKARIRQIQRQLATRRMLADVPKATVVVTNPTHYAVALRYERDAGPDGRADRAPVVVAKGADLVAALIKSVASEHGVALHEDVVLARALFRQADVGEEIPVELYAAVAVVIGHVWRLRGMRPHAEAASA